MADQDKIVKSPMEAKQGVELFRIRYVLIISSALAVIGMVIAFLIFGKY